MASPITHEHMAKLGDGWLTCILLGAAMLLIIVALYGRTLHKAIAAGWVVLP